MKFEFNDGGRSAAGYKGHTGDCVCRSIAIASGRPYQEIYDRLAEGNANERITKRDKRSKKIMRKAGVKTASHGINVRRKWFKDYMKELGFTWVPTMSIGSGCKVHLTDGELPMGRLVVLVSKHYTAVIDGVINDTYSPERNTWWSEVRNGVETTGISKRCVYGYYILNN